MLPSMLKSLFVSLSIAAAFGAPTAAIAGDSTGYSLQPGTYYFNGTCTDCTQPLGSPSPASAKLVISNPYTATFDYQSSLYPELHLDSNSIFSITGDTPSASSNPKNLTISFFTSPFIGILDFSPQFSIPFGVGAFSTQQTGSWSLTLDAMQQPNDIGNGGTWSTTAVPEPQTWALMLGGMAVVGAAMRRRSRA